MQLKSNKTIENVAYARGYIASSVQKVNQVAALVRGMPLEKALLVLQYVRRKPAAVIKEILKSAIANAQDKWDVDIDLLYIGEIKLGKAQITGGKRRIITRAKGRADYRKRYRTGITVTLR